MDWQTLVAVFCVFLAFIGAVRLIWQDLHGDESGCGNCPQKQAAAAPVLVELDINKHEHSR